MRAFGLDISVWQDDNATPQHVNFDKAVINGVDFVFIKASQRVADPDFIWNWKAAKNAGLLRGAYHYLDWRVSELEQAKLFVSLLAGDPGELPPVCDFEMREFAPSVDVMRGKLWNFLTYVERETKKIPAIYTGYYYWSEFGSTDNGWARYPLWLAWYRIAENKLKIPAPWKKWTFWQYDDKGDGLKYGCESKQVDMNWFNGTVADMRTWLAEGAGTSRGLQETPADTLFELVQNQNEAPIRLDELRRIAAYIENRKAQLAEGGRKCQHLTAGT